MNLLSLISPWFNINCQITTKYATVPKFKLFRELNTTLNGWRLIIVFCKWIGHLLTHFVCLFTIVACNLLLHFIGGSINSLVLYRWSVKSTSWKFDITILVTLHAPINELFSFHMIQKIPSVFSDLPKVSYTTITRTSLSGIQEQVCISSRPCWARYQVAQQPSCSDANSDNPLPETVVVWRQSLSASSNPILVHPLGYLIVWEPISVTVGLTSCWSQSKPRFWSPHRT